MYQLLRQKNPEETYIEYAAIHGTGDIKKLQKIHLKNKDDWSNKGNHF